MHNGALNATLVTRLVSLQQFPLDLDQSDENARLAQLLDRDEQARSQRIPNATRRRRFEAAHALTRVALARHLEVDPGAIVFTRGPGGKPVIAARPDVRFSLSHSGDRALLAIAQRGEVGVDIEQQRPVDVSGLAIRFFTRNEAKALTGMSGDDQLRGFFRCWTRKESLAKAVGEGLSVPLDSFEVGVDDASRTIVLNGSIWTVTEIPTVAGYVAALTVEGAGAQLDASRLSLG